MLELLRNGLSFRLQYTNPSVATYIGLVLDAWLGGFESDPLLQVSMVETFENYWRLLANRVSINDAYDVDEEIGKPLNDIFERIVLGDSESQVNSVLKQLAGIDSRIVKMTK